MDCSIKNIIIMDYIPILLCLKGIPIHYYYDNMGFACQNDIFVRRNINI
jgi:hypothetical protein